jgi:hypothetical protein
MALSSFSGGATATKMADAKRRLSGCELGEVSVQQKCPQIEVSIGSVLLGRATGGDRWARRI